jgi:hypothetical protein
MASQGEARRPRCGDGGSRRKKTMRQEEDDEGTNKTMLMVGCDPLCGLCVY